MFARFHPTTSSLSKLTTSAGKSSSTSTSCSCALIRFKVSITSGPTVFIATELPPATTADAAEVVGALATTVAAVSILGEEAVTILEDVEAATVGSTAAMVPGMLVTTLLLFNEFVGGC